MKKPLIVSLILGMLMLSSGVLTKVMTPVVIFTGQQAKMNLDTMIPKEFGT